MLSRIHERGPEISGGAEISGRGSLVLVGSLTIRTMSDSVAVLQLNAPRSPISCNDVNEIRRGLGAVSEVLRR